jgi:hypothetical protein
MYGVSYEAYHKAVSKRRLSRQEGGQEGEPEGMEPTEVGGGSNKLRNGIIVGVLVIILAVSLVVILQPEAATGLSVGLKSGTVIEANSSDVKLDIVLSLHNTTNQNVTFYGASYQLSDDGTSVGGGLWFDHVPVAAGATKLANETITIDLGDVIVVTPITSAGTWRLQGSATVEVGGANQTQGFDFNFSTQ